MDTVARLSVPLAELSLEAVYDGYHPMTSGHKYKLQGINGQKFKLNSSLEVALFIDKVAAIFGRPPAVDFYKTDTRRDVLVWVGYKKREWIDEGKWLANLAFAMVMEKQIREAFAKLKKEGDVIRFTLRSGKDMRAVDTIGGGVGVAFRISKSDWNRLAEIHSKNEIPLNFTVTAEYCETDAVILTAQAKELAQYVVKVEA